MKILFCDNTLWGLLNFRIDIVNYFLLQSYDVVLVAPDDVMCDKSLIPSNAKFIPVNLSRTGTNPVSDIKYFNELKRIYKSERPDYIFHYTIKPNIYGTLAAQSLNLKSTAMIAGLGHVYTDGGLSNAIARLMYKYAMQFPDHVLVLNKANLDTLLAKRVVKKNKLIHLQGGEGVNLEKFTQQPMPKNEKPVFLMICRLLYEKGYSQYVAAAEALGDRAIFRIMGPIDSHPSAVQRSTVDQDVKRGVIEYIEFSPNVAQQVANADCIVLPSFYGEGLSRVLMEGLATGRPLIASDIAGCRETIDDGVNGYLCEPRSSESLTDKCMKFISLSKQDRDTMAQRGREKAEKVFDINFVKEIYKNIIDKTL